MKLAIMQPYLFPYIGYFQLIKAVDTFVLYDDVAYINKGWINRNKILSNGQDLLFTVPLKNASQNKLICEIEVSEEAKWREKLIKTFEQSYKKAPQYEAVSPIFKDVILYNESPFISDMIRFSIEKTKAYLAISTKIVPTSSSYQNQDLKAQERILAICLKEKAQQYINPIGGVDLYDKDVFKQNGILLHFIKTKAIEYPQFKATFVPYLSILDVLLFCEKEQIHSFLNAYDLVN